LAFLIAENNDASKTKTLIKGADGKTRDSRRKSKGATTNEIDKITSGIMGIGDSFKHKPQLKKEFKLKLMKVIDTKSKAVGERDRKQTSNKNGKYILLGVVVVLAGVGLYFYLKNKKKMASEGMQVDGVDPATIEATPDVVVPPVVEPTPPITPEAPIEAVATPEVPPVV
jgi:LPXTG-motif cell wall-anchored protein